ncbi:hypothetical protein VNO77_07958 [Canavalia gladiata]|uniref:Uncharacterized protein n=1 Tax=Canavalia gladiata TaxID=3824 RepID=A0AAN9QW16_CANGL
MNLRREFPRIEANYHKDRWCVLIRTSSLDQQSSPFLQVRRITCMDASSIKNHQSHLSNPKPPKMNPSPSSTSVLPFRLPPVITVRKLDRPSHVPKDLIKSRAGCNGPVSVAILRVIHFLCWLRNSILELDLLHDSQKQGLLDIQYKNKHGIKFPWNPLKPQAEFQAQHLTTSYYAERPGTQL